MINLEIRPALVVLTLIFGCDDGSVPPQLVTACETGIVGFDAALQDACEAPATAAVTLAGPVSARAFDLAINPADVVAVVAADGEGVSLWQVNDGQSTHTDVWRGDVTAGPWVVWTSRRRPLVVWGASGGVMTWATEEVGAVVADPTLTPVDVIVVPTGAKVLSRGESWQILTIDVDGVSTATHFANSLARVGAAIGIDREGDNVVVTYADPTEEQGLWFLTSGVSIGTCSLPSRFEDAALGAAGVLRAATLSNGASAFAIQPPDGTCRPPGEIRIEALAGGFTFPLERPLEPGASFVPLGTIAALVTVEAASDGDAAGWTTHARFVDVRAPGLGARLTGPIMAGEVPMHWTVARGPASWVRVSSGANGIALQRYCYR